jgi:hypothetical protein
MSRLNACFLLLVLLLLPVRGAMAAMGLLCHGGPATASLAVAQAAVPAHAHAGLAHGEIAPAHAASAGHTHAAEALAALHQHDEDATAHGESDPPEAPRADACTLCAAVCGTPPLAAPGVRVPPPLDGGTLAFPPLVLTHPCHVADGLDRPPRSL